MRFRGWTLLLLVLAPSAFASTFLVPKDADLVGESEAIFIGTVVQSEARASVRRSIETVSDFEIEHVLKGDLDSRLRLQVVQPGGVLGRYVLGVAGAPEYRVGQRLLVFLTRDTQGRWTTRGMALGRFDFVRGADGSRLLVRGLAGHAIIGWDRDGAPHIEKQRSERAFIDAIGKAVRGERMPSDYFVETTRLLIDSNAIGPHVTATPASYLLVPQSTTRGARWNVFDGFTQISFLTQDQQTGQSDSLGAAQRAVGAWSNAAFSPVRLNISGTITGLSGIFSAMDGKNTIVFNDPSTEVPSGFAAYTNYWADLIGTNTFKGDVMNSIVEADTVIAQNIVTGAAQFDQLMAHEIGHAIGFRHSNEEREPLSSSAIMTFPVGSAYGANLQRWDKEAVNTVYSTTPLPCEGVVITTHPSSKTISEGDSTTLNVVATGSEPLSYSWYEGIAPDMTKSVGANSSSFTTPVLSETTKYWMKVSNACSAVSSNTATITVLPACDPINITQHPQSQLIVSGQAATLTVVHGGSAPFTYQWFEGDSGNASIPAPGGASSPTYMTPPLTSTKKYWVRISNSCTTINSNAAQVNVDDRQFAELSITAYPAGMLQTADTGGATDRFVVTNLAGLTSEVTLTKSGDFFSQSPEVFRLAVGESQVVTLTGLAKPAGSYEGVSVISATNAASQIRVPVKLLVAEVPVGTVDVAVSRLAVDVVDTRGVNESGTVELTNRGTATARGILLSDVEWLIPQSGAITIGAGQTVSVSFTIDDVKRPDSQLDADMLTGSLSFVYLTGGAGKSFGPSDTGSATGQTQTTISSSTFPISSVGAIPPIGNEVALAVAGVVKTASFMTRSSLISPSGSAALSNLKLFYVGAGGSPASAPFATVSALPPATPLAFADSLKLFGQTSGTGSLQIRGSGVSGLFASVRVFKTDDARGTVGYALPVSRSDRGTAKGASTVLSGLRWAAGTKTDIYLQEVSGKPITLQIDFIDRLGATVGTPRSETVGAFAFRQLTDAVPEQAVAALVRHADNSEGKVHATAIVVDEARSDATVVADWQQLYGASSEVAIVPLVVGRREGSSVTRTELSITNRGEGPASGELRYFGPAGSSRQRPVRRGGGSGKGLEPDASGSYRSKTIALGARETITIDDLSRFFGAAVDSTGYLQFVPTSGNVAITARLITTTEGSEGPMGTAIPVIPPSGGMKLGQKRSFAAIEDAGPESVARRVGGTFKTSFGLVEASGAGVTIRATFHYAQSFSGTVGARGQQTKVYSLGANESILIAEMGRDFLGAFRDSLRDLHDVQLDLEVIGGSGTVIPLLLSTDNGSADTVLRLE